MFGKAEDVVYYNREFHFLVAGDFGASIFCWPIFSQQGVLEAVNKGLCFVQPHKYRAYKQQPHVQYLMESRGELQMVVKLPTSEAWRFMVF